MWKSSWAAKVPKSKSRPFDKSLRACLCKITSMKKSSADCSILASFWLDVDANLALKTDKNNTKFNYDMGWLNHIRIINKFHLNLKSENPWSQSTQYSFSFQIRNRGRWLVWDQSGFDLTLIKELGILGHKQTLLLFDNFLTLSFINFSYFLFT